VAQVVDFFRKPIVKIDYSLVGINASAAVERGLAEADWYQSPVPRCDMRKLLERRDGPAIRDALLWFGLLGISGYATVRLWGSWRAIIPYLIYSILYATVSDSRWHEAGHGTAFKTDWLNNLLYEIASFMIVRESTPWRWSHVRHHSDTIIVGRDPEIAVPRPTNIWSVIRAFLCVGAYKSYWRTIVPHAFNRMTAVEATYIPLAEWPKVYRNARVHIAIYFAAIGAAIYLHSLLPVLLVVPHVFGTWLTVAYGMTQHAGLAENVLDHRLNCRTVYMNPIHRYLYWNMNYHLEHHMFPLVPYHALPRLHELIKDDCPPPYTGILNAWKEILPAIIRQIHDPGYYLRRVLPARRTNSSAQPFRASEELADGWLKVCTSEMLAREDVIRLDHGRKTYALSRTSDSKLHATDGICTHGNSHLADGLVKGGIIECPKHNGRFNLIDGTPARVPACRALAIYPIEEREEEVWVNVNHPAGAGAVSPNELTLRVVSNRSVATFIKELTLELANDVDILKFEPGDYLQIKIPAYDEIRFRDFDIPEPYAKVWEMQHVFELIAHNSEREKRNNYSLANNPRSERQLRFNVRVATPPPGLQCAPGVGSSYMFSLRPGDIVTALGPFGDFHIKPTQREMVYIGGGAGMAPLRAHLSSLLETEKTQRKVSFWYGARSKQEIFYDDFFHELVTKHPNFSFHIALSAPLDEDRWEGHEGFIHDVVEENHLRGHANAAAAEYYLCGPPTMIKATTKMLEQMGVPESQIVYDEF
jgi:Na+-transporting NADH:ubiquinone oxidoreductase subunit F